MSASTCVVVRHRASVRVALYREPTGRAYNRRMTTCPGGCTETHDQETASRVGDVDHAASILHDQGGAVVALHRLDLDGVPGPVRVVVDAGPDDALSPAQAGRLADAVDVALVLSAPCPQG